MEKNKTIILAVAVVAIIAVAAAAAVILTNDGDKGSDNEMTFLIQDDKGVFFWIEGSGDTAIEAFKDAIKPYEAAEFVASKDSKTGADYGIGSLYGMSTAQDEAGDWSWWAQYIWTGSAWEESQLMMDKYGYKDSEYVACVYGDGSVMPKAEPKDAECWDFSTKGVKFTIKSESGMEFYINGEGKTMLDAFKDAASDYNVPFKASTGAEGDYGVDSICGIEGTSTVLDDGKVQYYYWSQYYCNPEDVKWEHGNAMMSGIPSSDYKECLLVYETMVY